MAVAGPALPACEGFPAPAAIIGKRGSYPAREIRRRKLLSGPHSLQGPSPFLSISERAWPRIARIKVVLYTGEALGYCGLRDANPRFTRISLVFNTSEALLVRFPPTKGQTQLISKEVKCVRNGTIDFVLGAGQLLEPRGVSDWYACVCPEHPGDREGGVLSKVWRLENDELILSGVDQLERKARLDPDTDNIEFHPFSALFMRNDVRLVLE